jgi:RNA polymerase sigma-B factor
MAAYRAAEERDFRQHSADDADLLELVRQRPGDDPERRKACEILVGRYENIVRSCVRRYQAAPESAEDLMQVGYVGLMKAINNYDPAFGHGLAAYAQPCISGEIKRYFRDKRWQIRVQRPVQELRLQIRAAVPDLTHQLSRSPSDAELAVHLGIAEAEVTAAQLASQVFQVASLDAPLGADDSGGTAGDLLGSEDPGLEHALDMAAVWKHYTELPAREQRLLMMRFYGNMTQAQIGQQLGVSQMHVSRLLGRALAYLREKVTDLAEPVSE